MASYAPQPDFGPHSDLAERYASDLAKYSRKFPDPKEHARFVGVLNNLYGARLSARNAGPSTYAHHELMEQAEMMHERRQEDPHWKPSWAKW